MKVDWKWFLIGLILGLLLGCRLVDMGKDHEPRHIFLDELPEDAVGRKPKSCYVECGIFCTLGQQ